MTPLLFFAVILAGAVGTVARYLIGRAGAKAAWPWPVLLVNVVGSTVQTWLGRGNGLYDVVQFTVDDGRGRRRARGRRARIEHGAERALDLDEHAIDAGRVAHGHDPAVSSWRASNASGCSTGKTAPRWRSPLSRKVRQPTLLVNSICAAVAST